MIFDEEGNLLAQVEQYQVQVNVTNADYQPLGDPQQHEHLTSYKVTLSMTNTVIEDTKFIQGFLSVSIGKGFRVYGDGWLGHTANARRRRGRYKPCGGIG